MMVVSSILIIIYLELLDTLSCRQSCFMHYNYYLFVWAHVIDATYVNRRVGAMQPYAEK